jgi:hypothetical protein
MHVRFRTLILGVGALTAACSVLIDTEKEQCKTDADCTRFGDAVCSVGVCVSSSATLPDGSTPDGSTPPDGAAPDAGDARCTPKPPQSQSDFLNESCTNSQCIPFDNCARAGVCDGGPLPPLIDPPDGGV